LRGRVSNARICVADDYVTDDDVDLECVRTYAHTYTHTYHFEGPGEEV
jgi:hypothetical protein